jgi:hypothetical protein
MFHLLYGTHKLDRLRAHSLWDPSIQKVGLTSSLGRK